MDEITWWSQIDLATREWLIAHNGEALSTDAIAEISAVGGRLTADEWWVGEAAPEGVHLSDAAVDWIEAAANGE